MKEHRVLSMGELRARGFQALCAALGWVNAVRFLQQYEAGVGNYTEERRVILPEWDAATLARRAAAPLKS